MLSANLRIGHGYDVHQLVDERVLVICGVVIDYHKGSLGHSDGDVGIHAICDAILGALALGDLGAHFSSSDSKWSGQDSRTFLNHVLKLMNDEGYHINNIDCTIILQSPHLNIYIKSMRKIIAEICQININMVSIKATTTDKLGAIGRGEGIGASAIVLLEKQ